MVCCVLICLVNVQAYVAKYCSSCYLCFLYLYVSEIRGILIFDFIPVFIKNNQIKTTWDYFLSKWIIIWVRLNHIFLKPAKVNRGNNDNTNNSSNAECMLSQKNLGHAFSYTFTTFFWNKMRNMAQNYFLPL